MKTTLVKIKTPKGPSDWMFKVSTPQELFTEKYMRHEYKKAMQDGVIHMLNEKGQLCKDGENGTANISHFMSHLGEAAAITAIENKTNQIMGTALLAEKMMKAKLQAIREFGHILTNEVGGFRPYIKDDVIAEQVETEDFQYPKYTRDMIKIISWKGGIHYYAKIGGIDVVDNKGNQKWNSWETAHEKAIEYLQTLNS